MALVGRSGNLTWDFEFEGATHDCFYCGEVLAGDYFVMWRGNDEKGQEIWLHMDCSKRLADNLNKDHHRFRTGVLE